MEFIDLGIAAMFLPVAALIVSKRLRNFAISLLDKDRLKKQAAEKEQLQKHEQSLSLVDGAVKRAEEEVRNADTRVTNLQSAEKSRGTIVELLNRSIDSSKQRATDKGRRAQAKKSESEQLKDPKGADKTKFDGLISDYEALQRAALNESVALLRLEEELKTAQAELETVQTSLSGARLEKEEKETNLQRLKEEAGRIKLRQSAVTTTEGALPTGEGIITDVAPPSKIGLEVARTTMQVAEARLLELQKTSDSVEQIRHEADPALRSDAAKQRLAELLKS